MEPGYPDFAKLKAGDEVFISGNDDDELDIFKVKVDKVTPTGLIRIGKETFNRNGLNTKRGQPGGRNRPWLKYTNEVTTQMYLDTLERYKKKEI
jgi:hypothetical protein